MSKLQNKRILITGGTGSFGQAFVSKILKNDPDIKRIVIFSRDELKQWEMSNKFPISKFPGIRFFLGDIRDKTRLSRALEDIDIVVHAAALKQVPAAEYNPIEFINTNITGSNNLIQACLDANVRVVVALSTDKAAAPINLYGATKLCSDKLFIAANNIKGSRDLRLSVVRYGNVIGSRGSVIPYFLNQSKIGKLSVTDERMTRFNISLSEGVDLVLWSIENSLGGEIIVPKIPSYKITDVVKAITPNKSFEVIGKRPGEKIHEEMITTSDSSLTVDIGKYYLILNKEEDFKRLKKQDFDFKKVPEGFSYSSGNNEKFLSVDEIRDLIKTNIDEKNFLQKFKILNFSSALFH